MNCCSFCGCTCPTIHTNRRLRKLRQADGSLFCPFCAFYVPMVVLERGRPPHPNDDQWLMAARLANYQAGNKCLRPE